MNGKTFDFKVDLEFGHKMEDKQDRLWSPRFTVKKATDEEDRRWGIDRHLFPHCDSAGMDVPLKIPVQYKADRHIWRTGNVAIEYISNDTTPVTVGGWIENHAWWLSVYDVENDVCHVLDSQLLRRRFGLFWARAAFKPEYKLVRCEQDHGGGNTWCLLVPLSDLGAIYLFCIGDGIFAKNPWNSAANGMPPTEPNRG